MHTQATEKQKLSNGSKLNPVLKIICT